MVRKEILQERHEVQGGDGTVYCYHVLEKEEFAEHGRMYARFVLPPGTSIGWHVHEGETEPYYILSGEGTFTDSDGMVNFISFNTSMITSCYVMHTIRSIPDNFSTRLM